jgi:3-deoxy-D-manno-octulosonate 8-phosphate phosphatase KdsC-like HAD superfamily phosphatase
MKRPKSRLLVWGDQTTDRHQKVAVTVDVSVADSEGTLQVRADEVVAEDPGGAFRQLAEQVVELGELCRARVVAQLRVVHQISQSEVAWPVDGRGP